MKKEERDLFFKKYENLSFHDFLSICVEEVSKLNETLHSLLLEEEQGITNKTAYMKARLLSVEVGKLNHSFRRESLKHCRNIKRKKENG